MNTQMVMTEMEGVENYPKTDRYTSLRSHASTIKSLEKYKVHPRETLESVIKRAITTHGMVQEIKKRKRIANAQK